MPFSKMALTAGLIALVVGTLGHLLLPHVVQSDVAVGVLTAVIIGVAVYGGLTLLQRL